MNERVRCDRAGVLCMSWRAVNELACCVRQGHAEAMKWLAAKNLITNPKPPATPAAAPGGSLCELSGDESDEVVELEAVGMELVGAEPAGAAAAEVFYTSSAPKSTLELVASVQAHARQHRQKVIGAREKGTVTPPGRSKAARPPRATASATKAGSATQSGSASATKTNPNPSPSTTPTAVRDNSAFGVVASGVAAFGVVAIGVGERAGAAGAGAAGAEGRETLARPNSLEKRPAPSGCR